MTDAIKILQDVAKDKLLNQLVKAHEEGVASFLGGENVVQESASHDFTAYEFLYEPVVMQQEATAFSQDELDAIFQTMLQAIRANIAYEFTEVHRDGEGGADWEFWSRNEYASRSDESLARLLFDHVFTGIQLPLLSEVLIDVNPTERPFRVEQFVKKQQSISGNKLKDAIKADNEGNSRGTSIAQFDRQFSEALNDTNYWKQETVDFINLHFASDDALGDGRTRTFGHSSFTPFEADTVNFGLQLVYRQVWTPLGTQTGEIVRTIPLGPGQTEKISVKTVKKRSSRQERSQQFDRQTSNDTSSLTRDSSEVVEDASSRFNWRTELSASANWGWGDASVSGSLSGEKSKESRDTKSNLNEAMSKSADKLRVQTKIMVSTELQDELERSQVSEIKNTNDEVAVTYIYSKLQRRYRIHTYLAEVNTVAFVGASIPRKVELTPRWFARYAHVLFPVLLDGSYESDLELVTSRNSSARPDLRVETDVSVDQNLSKIIGDLANKGMPDFSQAAGSPPDQTAAVFAMYEREIERVREKDSEKERFAAALERLADHITNNALHYGRALWNAEDPDARIMRYKNIRVPAKWRFIRNLGDYRTNSNKATGGYVPTDDNPNNMIPLSELINPAGPIGYAGNYLAFYTRNIGRYQDLDQPLRAMRANFLERQVTVNTGEGEALPVEASVSPSLSLPAGGIRFTLKRITKEDNSQFYQLRYLGTVKEKPVDSTNPILSFSKLKLCMNGAQSLHDILTKEGEVLRGTISTISVLEDPELTELKWKLLPMTSDHAAFIFNGELIDAIKSSFMKSLLKNHTPDDLASLSQGWNALSEDVQSSLKRLYPHHVLDQRYTRHLLLDSDNLVLSRVVDDASSIEPFKALHRYVDVLGAVEDLSARSQETIRLQERLKAGNLNDPDVESQKVIIADTDQINVGT